MEKENRVTFINKMEDKEKAKKLKNFYRYISLISILCSIFILVAILFFAGEYNSMTYIYLVVLSMSITYCGVMFYQTFKMKI